MAPIQILLSTDYSNNLYNVHREFDKPRVLGVNFLQDQEIFHKCWKEICIKFCVAPIQIFLSIDNTLTYKTFIGS